MIAGIRMRHIRTSVSLAFLAAAALLSAGCGKLKARDNLNQGVNAFKAGNYSQAADHFKTAIDLDPDFEAPRIYLATAYVNQYIPGTETAENKKFADAAMAEFQKVLATTKDEKYRILATESIANLYYQMKNFPRAQEWNKKVVELDPRNKEAYYTLGVIPWTDFVTPDREARLASKMKVEEPGPIKDPKLRAELKAKHWGPLTEGIEYEKKALQIDPEYENAMAYMNLLIRYRADLLDTPEEYQSAAKEADSWVEKNMQTMKMKAERKAANPNAK